MATNITNDKAVSNPRDVTCTSSGKVCDPDCQRIWACVNNNGQFKPALIGTCQLPKTCNNGVCRDTPTPDCTPAARKPFPCQSEGIFPDPITCKKYHYCIKNSNNELEDFERECKINLGYNPRTTYCDKKLVNNQCAVNYPVPICTVAGQHGALKENRSIYFVCSIYGNSGDVLYPYLYLCEDGKVYNGNYGCR